MALARHSEGALYESNRLGIRRYSDDRGKAQSAKILDLLLRFGLDPDERVIPARAPASFTQKGSP